MFSRITFVLLLSAGAAYAADKVDPKAAEELAKKSACFSCHALDKKIVGPSYKEIATKYKNDKTAEAKLIEKVKKGGGGVWGPVPMPPNAHIKDQDIKTLVQWVLSLK